jgi:hypothetical protein
MYLPMIVFGGYLLAVTGQRALERVRRAAAPRTAVLEPPGT